jgi:DNA-binding FrmR family transcriptional regulator
MSSEHPHAGLHTHSHVHQGEQEEHRHGHQHTQTKAVLNRMSRAIGHLTAVRGMVENGRDCSEILIQLSAVRSALNGICKMILKDHIDHCIVDAVNTGDLEKLQELNKAIEMLLK